MTRIDLFFLEKFSNIVAFETVLRAGKLDETVLRDAKKMGISDEYIGQVWGMSEGDVYRLRKKLGIYPCIK